MLEIRTCMAQSASPRAFTLAKTHTWMVVDGRMSCPRTKPSSHSPLSLPLVLTSTTQLPFPQGWSSWVERCRKMKCAKNLGCPPLNARLLYLEPDRDIWQRPCREKCQVRTLKAWVEESSVLCAIHSRLSDASTWMNGKMSQN